MRIAIVLSLALAFVACGGRQTTPEGGEQILASGEWALGTEEDRAVGFLLDLAFVLEASMDDPARAVERVQAVLAVNANAMRENAVALEARLDELSGEARRRYEAQFAVHVGAAHQQWRDRLAAFTSAWPTEGRQVSRLLSDFSR